MCGVIFFSRSLTNFIATNKSTASMVLEVMKTFVLSKNLKRTLNFAIFGTFLDTKVTKVVQENLHLCYSLQGSIELILTPHADIYVQYWQNYM